MIRIQKEIPLKIYATLHHFKSSKAVGGQSPDPAEWFLALNQGVHVKFHYITDHFLPQKLYRVSHCVPSFAGNLDDIHIGNFHQGKMFRFPTNRWPRYFPPSTAAAATENANEREEIEHASGRCRLHSGQKIGGQEMALGAILTLY